MELCSRGGNKYVATKITRVTSMEDSPFSWTWRIMSAAQVVFSSAQPMVCCETEAPVGPRMMNMFGKPSTWIPYFDADCLYGLAMMLSLPYSDFRFVEVTVEELLSIASEYRDDDAQGYIVEIDTECPDEFHDLGTSQSHHVIISEMKDLLLERLIDRKNRITMTDEEVYRTRKNQNKSGIMIGIW